MSGPTEPDERLAHWEGEPVRVWRTLWSVPHLEVWRRVGSTNDRGRELVRDGCGPYTVVLAEEQTEGRGRKGRRWSSPPGAGLWMSVVLRPRIADVRRLAPILAGLAVCRAVERAAPGAEPGLKWPNDVLVRGGKACGILCESAGDTVVAGIGVNVRQRPDDFPPEIRRSATSLERATGCGVSRPELAGAILTALRALADRSPLGLDGELRREVRSRDVLAGRRVRVHGGLEGTARGIARDGALLVEDEGGEHHRIVAGTVRSVDGVGAERAG